MEIATEQFTVCRFIDFKNLILQIFDAKEYLIMNTKIK